MIGLDIGTYSIKAVELKKEGDLFALINFKIQERPQESQEPLSLILKKFFEEGNFTTKEVNISVSGPLVVVRLVELPEMSDGELKNAIRFEAEKFLHFNINEAILDYQVVLKNPQLKKITVLLAAVKNDFVKNYVDSITQLGFIVKGVDVDGIALTNAFLNTKKGEPDKAFALLNIGDAFLNMSIVYQDIPFVLRDIGIETASPGLDQLAKEIRLSLGYFENQFAKSVEKIYLSGGSSRLSGLKEFLAEALEIQIELWDPFSTIKMGDNISIKALEETKTELAVAVGLAVRDD